VGKPGGYSERQAVRKSIGRAIIKQRCAKNAYLQARRARRRNGGVRASGRRCDAARGATSRSNKRQAAAGNAARCVARSGAASGDGRQHGAWRMRGMCVRHGDIAAHLAARSFSFFFFFLLYLGGGISAKTAWPAKIINSSLKKRSTVSAQNALGAGINKRHGRERIFAGCCIDAFISSAGGVFLTYDAERRAVGGR